MVKAKEFSNAGELQHIINTYNIKREDIIDIKWAATSHCSTYGLLVYEESIEPLDYTYSGCGF